MVDYIPTLSYFKELWSLFISYTKHRYFMIEGINIEFLIYFITTMISLIVVAAKGGNKLGTIETSVKWLTDNFKDLKTEVENIKQGAYASNSPISLTPKGTTHLKGSGLETYIDERKDKLIGGCKATEESTAYEIQSKVFDMFEKIVFDGDFEQKFKNYAFEQGISMDILRRIGAIYFRNICLEHYKLLSK